MEAAIGLLEVFVVAIIIALLVTISSVSSGVPAIRNYCSISNHHSKYRFHLLLQKEEDLELRWGFDS